MSVLQRFKGFFAVQFQHKMQKKPVAVTQKSSQPDLEKNQATATAFVDSERLMKGSPSILSPSEKVFLSYDSDLIPKLIEEHRLLLNEFAQIHFLVSNNQFATGLQALQSFRSKLLNHLHLKNLKLYMYLQYSLSSSSEEFTKMRVFRKKMSTTGKIVLDIFDKYEKIELSYENKAEFLSEFSMISVVLSKRIQREEEWLYSMYQRLA